MAPLRQRQLSTVLSGKCVFTLITSIIMVVFILDLHKDREKSGRSVGKVSVTLMALFLKVVQRKLMVEDSRGIASCKVFVTCHET